MSSSDVLRRIMHFRTEGKIQCEDQYFVGYLKYRGADKSLVRPTSRCILFDG